MGGASHQHGSYWHCGSGGSLSDGAELPRVERGYLHSGRSGVPYSVETLAQAYSTGVVCS